MELSEILQYLVNFQVSSSEFHDCKLEYNQLSPGTQVSNYGMVPLTGDCEIKGKITNLDKQCMKTCVLVGRLVERCGLVATSLEDHQSAPKRNLV
ncbi:hypothetical protein NPIL_304741 [Nephila pilipes]|uniref:Uncharacterized protein n=1 Tax=Nephila pilipes TaxID=299642 RepID=A0A8X6NS91_NEPPI|nr:hypothetical protein NPIL_304741 [Nephila pilipes]